MGRVIFTSGNNNIRDSEHAMFDILCTLLAQKDSEALSLIMKRHGMIYTQNDAYSMLEEVRRNEKERQEKGRLS